MGKVLAIAENFSQAQKLSEPFNHEVYKDYIEVFPCNTFPRGATIVHDIDTLCELVSPGEYNQGWAGRWSLDQLPIIPKKIKLKVSPSKKESFDTIKKFVMDDSISSIIHCGEASSENEIIISEILFMMGNKKTIKRFLTNSLSNKSVKESFNNLRDIEETKPLYFEALARQKSEWILGTNLTRLMTLLIQSKGLRGRNAIFPMSSVVGSLINLIYKRERQIETFVSKPSWSLFATFKMGDYEYEGKWYIPNEDRIFNYDEAVNLAKYCNGQAYVIYTASTDEIEVRPPQFYNLTTLQEEANEILGLSPAKTLEIAKSLYEKGLISYPVVESRHVTKKESRNFPVILNNLSDIPHYKEFLPAPIKDISNDNRYVDAAKADGHHAIILTEESVDLDSLSEHEEFIYDMIAKSLIASHYQDAIYQQTEVISVVSDMFTFKTEDNHQKTPGWKVIFEELQNENSIKSDSPLSVLEAGNEGLVTNTEIRELKTSPPDRFSQGDLVRIMENSLSYMEYGKSADFLKEELSLGTIATRANIINKIIDYKYISIQNNDVYLEPKGRILIEALGESHYIVSPLTTGRMERYLKGVSQGKNDYKKYIQRTINVTKEQVISIIKDSENWELDEYIQEYRQRIEVVGACLICRKPVIDKGNFYGCTGYQESGCSFTLPKTQNGKTLEIRHIEALLENRTTPLIKGFKKKNKDGYFDAFLAWNEKEHKIVFNFDGVPPPSSF